MKTIKIEKTKKKKVLYKNCFIHNVLNNEKHKTVLFKMYTSKKKSFRISSKKNLPLAKHKKFVKSHPYRYWFLIFNKNFYIGNFYITFDNIIGLNLYDNYTTEYNKIISSILKKFKPLKEIPSVRRGVFMINISSQNRVFEKILKKTKWKVLQKTYILK